jgi:hypothetical protein
MQEQSENCADPAEERGRKGCPKGTAPTEWVRNTNFSVRILMHHSGATEAFLRQFPECSPGFILFCEISNENADAHYLPFFHYAA